MWLERPATTWMIALSPEPLLGDWSKLLLAGPIGLLEPALREVTQSNALPDQKTPRRLFKLVLSYQNMFVQESTFLGAATRGAPRRNSEKEDARRVAVTCAQFQLLATLRLNADKFAVYARYFAISKVTYGWLGRPPTQALCQKLGSALKAGQRVTRMANKWVRALCMADLPTLMSELLQTFFVLCMASGPKEKQIGAPYSTLVAALRNGCANVDGGKLGHGTGPVISGFPSTFIIPLFTLIWGNIC